MDVKSSCMNDQCLFITSIDTIPPIPPVTFDFQYANMISYESVFNKQVHLPAKNTILYHSYHKAVDLDTETCWYSYRGSLYIKSMCMCTHKLCKKSTQKR